MIPKKGTWIMIRQEIPVEVPIDPFSFWYAVPSGKLFWREELTVSRFNDTTPYWLMAQLRERDFERFKTLVYNYFFVKKAEIPEDVRKKLKAWEQEGEIDKECLEQQVKIKTPFGDVCVQPYEYLIPKELGHYIEAAKDGHAFIRYMNETKILKGKIADQVFYLRSRGIKFKDAITLCFQNISTQNLFYVEMHPEYQKALTRNWDRYWEKKVAYCTKVDRMDLLNYGKFWDFSKPLSMPMIDEDRPKLSIRK